ncbi:MAG: hypothetical protein FWF81_10135 [Defluviitaleaceae bacterium]|nr:hypothetical protein [Defluviitaleaceae bacterium]
MNKLGWQDFINADLASDVDYSWDVRPFVSHMSDVWGEANRAIKYFDEWKNNETHDSYEKFMQQINLFHDICANIYANSTVFEEGKFELKLAQWELYDYCLWDNTFKNNSKSVMRWFDEWAYQANYVE